MSQRKNCDKTDDYDPELDILSEHFNPLRALTTDRIINLPETNAPIYDNLASCESALHRQQHGEQTKGKSSSTKQQRADGIDRFNRCAAADDVTLTARRFLPHQGMRFLSTCIFLEL